MRSTSIVWRRRRSAAWSKSATALRVASSRRRSRSARMRSSRQRIHAADFLHLALAGVAGGEADKRHEHRDERPRDEQDQPDRPGNGKGDDQQDEWHGPRARHGRRIARKPGRDGQQLVGGEAGDLGGRKRAGDDRRLAAFGCNKRFARFGNRLVGGGEGEALGVTRDGGAGDADDQEQSNRAPNAEETRFLRLPAWPESARRRRPGGSTATPRRQRARMPRSGGREPAGGACAGARTRCRAPPFL